MGAGSKAFLAVRWWCGTRRAATKPSTLFLPVDILKALEEHKSWRQDAGVMHASQVPAERV